MSCSPIFLYWYAQSTSTKRSTQLATGAKSAFCQQVKAMVLANLENESFGVAELSQALYLSRSQLHRKIKAQTGLSPSVFMRKIRLHEAKRLLEAELGNITEVAFSVGMINLAYFSRSFKAEFGYSPSQLRTGERLLV